VALCDLDQALGDFLVGTGRSRAPISGVLLVATRSADVDGASAVSWFVEITILGFEVVSLSEFVERRGLGPEVRAAFFGEGRAAHRRHPRQ
jgi:hypothetical protein